MKRQLCHLVIDVEALEDGAYQSQMRIASGGKSVASGAVGLGVLMEALKWEALLQRHLLEQSGRAPDLYALKETVIKVATASVAQMAEQAASWALAME